MAVAGVGRKHNHKWDYKIVLVSEKVDEAIIYSALNKLMEIRPEFLTKSNAKHGKLLERRGVVEFPMETDTLVLTRTFLASSAKTKGVIVRLFWKSTEVQDSTEEE
jgi:hypothetical protein